LENGGKRKKGGNEKNKYEKDFIWGREEAKGFVPNKFGGNTRHRDTGGGKKIAKSSRSIRGNGRGPGGPHQKGEGGGMKQHDCQQIWANGHGNKTVETRGDQNEKKSKRLSVKKMEIS